MAIQREIYNKWNMQQQLQAVYTSNMYFAGVSSQEFLALAAPADYALSSSNSNQRGRGEVRTSNHCFSQLIPLTSKGSSSGHFLNNREFVCLVAYNDISSIFPESHEIIFHNIFWWGACQVCYLKIRQWWMHHLGGRIRTE